MKTIHRILTPILSLLIFPVTIFLPMFRIMITSGLAAGESKTNVLANFGLSEFMSLKDVYLAFVAEDDGSSSNFFKLMWQSLSGEKKQEFLDKLPGIEWGVVFVALLAIVLIVALALIIISAATKKPGASLILSAFGAVCAFFMNSSFDAFARPFVSGTFNLNTLLGNTNQILGVILGSIAKFEYMKLGIAYSVIILIFVCTAILSICAYVEQKNEDK